MSSTVSSARVADAVPPMRHAHRAMIPPVPEGEPRPRWSVMIPTYHCAEYLEQTLASVLVQDQGPARMQIEVVDDGSTRDDPRAVAMRVGAGRVAFFAQANNVGITQNFATCLMRSRGELVHLLHGDDYVRPGFYDAMERAFEAHREIGAAFCRAIYMRSDGHWTGITPLEQTTSGPLAGGVAHLALEQRIMTPSMVIRREVYERLGGFDDRLLCAEDWEMWVRVAAEYPVWYETEPLAVYRMHDDSNTGRHLHSADDARYTREAIQIFTTYLPHEVAADVSRRARRTYAFTTLDTASRLAQGRDIVGALRQTREALRLSRAPIVFASIARRMSRHVLSVFRSHRSDARA